MNDAVDPDLLLAEGRALRALARCLVGEADADDVVHDAQLALLRTRGAARQAGPWLAGTVRKLAAMLRRGDARRRMRELAVARDEVDAAADPVAIAAQAEVVRRVAAAVHALEEPFRTVVLLRFWHGLLPDAIAARLGVPRNTVRSRLQRGLARLRERLDADGGRAQWAAPLGAFVGVREGAVGTAAVGGLVLAGVMMKTKVSAAVGVVLAAVLVMPAVWPGGGAAQQVDASAVGGAAAVVASAPTENADAEALLQREAAPVAASAPAAAADKELPKAVEPWQLRVLVVDEDDQPLPNQQVRLLRARITATTPEPVDRERRMAPHAKETPITPPVDDLLAVPQTDASGRLTTTVECESVVAAIECEGRLPAKRRLQRGVDGARERKLMLPRARKVRGRVELADGSVALDARVHARGNYAPPPDPDAVPVDASGCFELLLRPRCGYELWATIGDQSTFREQIETYREITEPVVLQVPGARSIRGSVVDSSREPMADAEVRAWREGPGKTYSSRAEPESYTVRSDRAGRFTIPIRGFARYGVFASKAGAGAATVQIVEPTYAMPHVEVQLAMPAAMTITGRVRREDGSPVAGVPVQATPPTLGMPPWGQPSLHDRFSPTQGTTDAEGGFALTVHPGTPWNLTAYPVAGNPQFVVERTNVAAGSVGVDLLVHANELRSATVRGMVVDAQGVAVPSFSLSLVAIEDGRAAGRSGGRLEIDGNRFESMPLPVGRSYAIDVEPERPEGAAADGARVMADVRFGPFVVPHDGLDVTIRLPDVGVLPVRLVRADGGSMRGISTLLTRVPRFGVEQVSALRVDATGRCTWTRVTPGTNKLAVFGPDDPVHALHEQEVVIVPGLNPDLTVTLPATATPR